MDMKRKLMKEKENLNHHVWGQKNFEVKNYSIIVCSNFFLNFYYYDCFVFYFVFLSLFDSVIYDFFLSYCFCIVLSYTCSILLIFFMHVIIFHQT